MSDATLPDLRPQAARRTPDQTLAHLRAFDLDPKFSAGIWFFSPAQSRFHAKYSPDLSIEQRLDIAAKLAPAGLKGLEAHYPNEINDDNLSLWQDFSASTGIRILSVIPLLFHDALFEFGSLSNPDPGVRREAIDRASRAFALNKRLATDFAIVWPGIDGYESGFGMDFAAARARFAEGLAEAMDSVPGGGGVRVAFEPKPYEPRGRILFGTTPEGVLLGRDVDAMLTGHANRALLQQGHALCCLNPEVGHMLMGYEDPAYAFSLALAEGRLAHTHWNSQPLGNYDQDLGVGAISPEITEGILYTLKLHGYRGWFGIDINPERTPVDIALRNSFDALRAANDRINALDHESIIAAHAKPASSRGWLEGYLTRVRASRPERLGAWGRLV